MDARILNVGLIGFGLAGRYFHAPFLKVHPGFQLKKVSCGNPLDLAQFDPAVAVVPTAAELLQDDALDVVFICSPNDTHYEYARQALERGKHLVVEKPFATSERETSQLLALAAQRGLVATAHQNRRWDADFLTIRRLLGAGTLGQVIEYEAYYNRYSPVARQAHTWKEKPGDGRGNFYNLGPHLIDQALQLFGSPSTVTADIKTLRPESHIDDYFDLRLGYADKQVRLKSSLLNCDHQLRYRLHGTAASFTKSGLDVQEETLRLGGLPTGPDWGREPAARWGTLTRPDGAETIESEPGSYLPFYQNLHEAITQGAAPAVSPLDIQRIARTVELAFTSAREHTTLTF